MQVPTGDGGRRTRIAKLIRSCAAATLTVRGAPAKLIVRRAPAKLVVRGALALMALALGAASASAPAAAEVPVEPYGANGIAGFRDVIAGGEDGLVNATQLIEFEAKGTVPPHFKNQLPLYSGLINASPTLTHEQIPLYFKDATFGVKEGEVESTESPRSDVTIERDKGYGIPHIYASTRGGVMFGAGYAAAEDRLFLMDVLRHTARAELSSFVGGAEGNRAMDRAQWMIAPYTEADLESQVAAFPKLYGKRGEQAVEDVKEFVAGINAYIQAAELNPNLMPAEYAALGKIPEEWKVTDVIAEASLIGGIFGKGGGAEVQSALTAEAFEKQFGKAKGRRAWEDFREANDPEAPTTVSASFPYETGKPFSKRGLAMPEPGSVEYVNDGEVTIAAPATSGAGARAGAQTATVSGSGAQTGTVSDSGAQPGSVPGGDAQTGSSPGSGAQTGSSPLGGAQALTDTPDPQPIPNEHSIGAQLMHNLLDGPALDSNWELVNKDSSTDGHSIAVMGPQVGYYNPEILMEEDLHGPGIDAEGAAFSGVNMYVELGHGRDYAWSATTSTADNIDTFADVLCEGEYHYLYDGKCVPMEKLERENTWTPNIDDETPPGKEKLTVYRAINGIVFARGKVDGKPVAFASLRSTYFHEADSAIGFSELNEPEFLTGPEKFETAASNINFLFNWSYIDANNIAYYNSGWLPVKARGVSPDFPTLGTGQYQWKGFNPTLHTEDDLAADEHPNAINPPFLVSWNNKQAPNFSAADDKYAFGSIYRMQLIRNFIEKDIAGGKKMGTEKLISAMDEAATQDIRIVELWPILKEALGTPSNPKLAEAIAELESWYQAGGHRRDLANTSDEGNGTYEHNEAITIMDAWWPKLLEAEFRPALGGEAFDALRGMLEFGDPEPGAEPSAPEFADGWYGYVSTDLRDLLAKAKGAHKPTAPYSRIYCGNGSLEACQQALQKSLLEALSVTPQEIYGHGECKENAQASCFDLNRFTSASGIPIAAFPFQNRPTFQQVDEPTQIIEP